MVTATPESKASTLQWGLALSLLLLVAFALRAVYAFTISPYSDEYITLVAARAVLQKGVPLLPSGLYYDHGLLFVYLDALFLGLMGFSEQIGRLASAFVGVLTVALIYAVGRRWSSRRAGLFAALALALASEEILWQGRARMYSLLQLLFLLGAFLVYEGFVRRDRRLYRSLGMVALACAALTHLLTVPYTAVMVAALLLNRWWTRRRGEGFPLPATQLWPEASITLIAIGLRLLLRSLSGPWGAGGRVTIDPNLLVRPAYVLTHLLVWMQSFIAWPNLIWSALILAGLLGLSLRLLRHSGQPGDAYWSYVLLVWLGNIVGLSIFSIWYSPGYVFALLPFFYLAAAGELDRLYVVIQEAGRQQAVVVSFAATLLLIVGLMAPGAWRTVSYDPLQLEQALGVVREHLRQEDIVASFAPHASLIVLGRVDFYAQEQGYPFVETHKGRVDMWTASPILDSVEKLDRLLDGAHRVWLIVHRQDWQRHYSATYRQRVEARMELVFDGSGTLVYVSKP